MAKKAVPKTGAYIFQEEIVVNEKVNEFFK